jgi:hypothetical protein
MKSLLPPRKKDWQKGTWQVGLFIRTPDGAQVVSVWDAPVQVKESALALLNERFPEIKKLEAGQLSAKEAKKISKTYEKAQKR